MSRESAQGITSRHCGVQGTSYPAEEWYAGDEYRVMLEAPFGLVAGKRVVH